MNAVKQMKKFVEPKSVALLGASRRTGEDAFNIIENLLSYGYQGRIYPVNPNVSEILGLKTYPRITDINNEIDLAIINLPRSLVPSAVRECTKQGIQSIIIVTQGFADASDEEGKQLQKEIDELIKKSGIRILGPNTLGIANAFINFSSSFRKIELVRVPVGIICQTGVFFTGFPGLRLIGKGIDLGNACDIDIVDGLEYFEQDDDTKIIALHIEGIRDGERFLRAANRLAQRKPVVALKTGKSEYAAQAVQSHTGSLVGKDEVWETALRQSGVIRVNDIDELGDSVRAFSSLPLMKGRKIGIISASGGLGIMSIDACHKFNLEVAKLSSITMERINALSPSWMGISNPVDIWPAYMVQKQPMTELLTESIGAVLNDYEVDAALFMWAPISHQNCSDLCQLLVKLAEAHQDKPLVCSLHGPYAEEARNNLEVTGRVIVFHNPDRAIRALAHLARYSAFRRGF